MAEPFYISIAGSVFEVACRYPDTRELCADYLVENANLPPSPIGTIDSDAADANLPPSPVRIEISQDDIDYEDEKSVREALYEGLPVVRYTPGYLESIAVHRHIAEWYSRRGAAVFHGALVERGGRGYLFTAKSGTGKTTHVRNWLAAFPDARIINGDKPILRAMDDQVDACEAPDCAASDLTAEPTFCSAGDLPSTKGRVIAYGTPWCGKEGWNVNESVPLAGIAILERAEDNRIEPVAFGDAVGTLVSQTYRAADGEGTLRALRFVASLQGKVSVYRLGCNMDVASARVAYEGMARAWQTSIC